MPAPRYRRGWWLLPAASFVVLGMSFLPAADSSPGWEAMAIGAVLIGLLVNYPIPGGDGEASLAHAISLTLGLSHGPAVMAVTLAVGLTAGEVVRGFWRRAPAHRQGNAAERLRASSLTWSLQIISPSAALLAFQALGGEWVAERPGLPALLPTIVAGIVFAIVFLLLNGLTHYLQGGRRLNRTELTVLALLAVLPVPYAAAVASAYTSLGGSALILLGSVPAVVSPALRTLILTDRLLQRRVDELSVLGRVSQALQTGLSMDIALTTIYQQVAHLLQADSFYVALYNPEEDELTFPLAVREGSRQQWASRPLADRLTDRVIQSAAPILIPRDVARVIGAMGLPDTNNAPASWLGVPLLSADRALGCLAAFHAHPGRTLTERDLDILTTLAGQASVAIENASLYEQTRRRADALASLNEIAAGMSSTLDPERTLELVGLSIVRVGGGGKSAIFLHDPEHSQLTLARATNLTEGFIQESRVIALSNTERCQAFHSGVPDIVPDVDTSGLSPEHIRRLRGEGVRAYADFPLSTPGGTIGQLSVYFAEPQRFRADQVELLRTFAAQAALAVANARAHAATDEALQRRVAQLGALEAIGREMAATLDQDRLFETILDHAQRSTRGDRSYLAIFDQERQGLRVVARRGFPAGALADDPERLYPTDQGAMGRAVLSGEPCRLSADEVESLSPFGEPLGSILSAPILQQELCLGAVIVESARPLAFADEDEQFLAQLAAQAAIALSNAGLYQQLEARLREQSLLYQASAQIAATLESEAVAQAAADTLGVALSADASCITRWDPVQRTISLRVALRGGLPIRDGVSATVQLQDVPALENALHLGRPVQWTLDSAPTPQDRDYLRKHRNAASVLAVPLIVGEEALGFLEATSDTRRVFGESEVRTAQTIGAQAAIALQNTDLFRRISESYDRLMAVLNSTQEGMLMIDTAGRVVLVNPQLETLTGLSVRDSKGALLSDPGLRAAAHLGYAAGDLAGLLDDLALGQAPSTGLVRYESETPPRRALQRTDTPVRDARGALVGWLIVVRDITEDRKLEDTRRQLTEMIVHDLRSPLTAILSSLKLLDEAAAVQPQSAITRQALTVSHRSVQQMLILVNSLLDIAKLEAGELRLGLKPVDLEKLCAELLPPYVQEANEQGIILHHTVEPGLPRLTADPGLLERILVNLLDNALKFTPAGGRVELQIGAAGSEVQVSVSDTGPGIAAEFRERIFERFGQVPGSSGRRHGTGLGLAFAKLAVEAHGGRIWIEDNPAGGSRFCLRLTLRDA